MKFIVLLGVVLLVVSGPAEAMINVNPYATNRQLSKRASNALKLAIEATRPTVQLPVSANKFVDAVLAEACDNCHRLGRLIEDIIEQQHLTAEFAELSPELPPRIAETYNDLLGLYDALQSRQQLIDETGDNWRQELVRDENDNYLQLLTETKTAINQMLDDLRKVVDEYGYAIEHRPDADMDGDRGTLWGMEEEPNPLWRDSGRKDEDNRHNADSDLALLGAAALLASNGYSDDSSVSSVYDHVRDMEVGKAFADSLNGGSGVLGNNSILDDNGVDTAIDILDLLLF